MSSLNPSDTSIAKSVLTEPIQSLQVMNMVMSSMNIISDKWSQKGFVIIILVMNLTGYVRDHYLGNTIYDNAFVIIILVMVFRVIL